MTVRGKGCLIDALHTVASVPVERVIYFLGYRDIGCGIRNLIFCVFPFREETSVLGVLIAILPSGAMPCYSSCSQYPHSRKINHDRVWVL